MARRKAGAVACYARVSTSSQNLAGQVAEIQRWLNGHGIEDARWFIDRASGKNLDRPAFEDLQSAIFSGEVGTIVCFKLDRISRSLRDGVAVLEDWLAKGVRVVATSQELDFSGAVGKLVAAVLMAVAEMERANIRERQAAGIREAKRRGVYKGRQRGAVSRKTKGRDTRIMEMRSKGLSHQEIATALGVSTKTIQRRLKELPEAADLGAVVEH